MASHNSSSGGTRSNKGGAKKDIKEDILEPTDLTPAFDDGSSSRISKMEVMMEAMMNKLDQLSTPIKEQASNNPSVNTPAQNRRQSLFNTLAESRKSEETTQADDNLHYCKDNSSSSAVATEAKHLKDLLSFGDGKSDASRGYLSEQLVSSNRISAAGPMVMKVESAKECPIRIKRLQLSVSAAAIQAIIDFQNTHEQTVRIQKVLEPNVKDHLRLAYSLSNEEISKMTTDDLIQIIAYETRVQSIPSFYEELNAAITVSVPEWSKVNAVTHETFYYQQLKLIGQFRSMLGVMLFSNKKYCPRADNKPYGLITMFKFKNDRNYMKFAMAEMTRDKWDTMTQFLDEFGEVCLRHYNTSKVARELPYTENEQHKASTRKFVDTLDTYDKTKKRIFGKRDSVNNIVEPETVDPVLSESDAEEEDDPVYYFGDQEITPSVVPMPVPKAMLESDSDNETLQDGKNGKLNNMDNSTKRESQGCLRYILRGECKRGSECKYLHSKEACLKTADSFIEKMKDYKNGKCGSIQIAKRSTNSNL